MSDSGGTPDFRIHIRSGTSASTHDEVRSKSSVQRCRLPFKMQQTPPIRNTHLAGQAGKRAPPPLLVPCVVGLALDGALAPFCGSLLLLVRWRYVRCGDIDIISGIIIISCGGQRRSSSGCSRACRPAPSRRCCVGTLHC